MVVDLTIKEISNYVVDIFDDLKGSPFLFIFVM